MVVILTLISLGALFVSLIAFSTATTILQEIMAGIGIIIFVISLASAGIIEAINRIYKEIKQIKSSIENNPQKNSEEHK